MRTVLGALINRRRRELRISQKALGEKLNISGQAVSGWEIGGKYPDITTLPALMRALSLTEEEIMRAIEGIETEIETWTDFEKGVTIPDENKPKSDRTVSTNNQKMTERALRECFYSPKDKTICITNPLRDSIEYSLRRSEVYLISGYDATIRTQTLLNIINTVLTNQQGRVYFFTMGELGKDMIKQLIGINAQVSTRFYLVNDYTEDEKKRIDQAGNCYRNAHLYIDEGRYHSIEEIYQKCTGINEDLDLIVINGLKNISVEAVPENSIEARYERNRDLHGIAIDCMCPIIITSDMDNSDNDRDGLIPRIEDIADKEITESANHVWLVDRQDRYRNPSEWNHIVEIRVVKERYRNIIVRKNDKPVITESSEVKHKLPYRIVLNYNEMTGCLKMDNIIGMDE